MSDAPVDWVGLVAKELTDPIVLTVVAVAMGLTSLCLLFVVVVRRSWIQPMQDEVGDAAVKLQASIQLAQLTRERIGKLAQMFEEHNQVPGGNYPLLVEDEIMTQHRTLKERLAAAQKALERDQK